jgi:quercetin dioxygenase-like cupin family protein
LSARDALITPRAQHQLAHHHEEQRPDAFTDRLLWISEEQAPGSPLFITSRGVVGLVDGEGDEGTDVHTHDADQIYLLIGEAGDLRVELTISGETAAATAPATLYIPANVPHSLRIVEGTGTVVAILAAGTYS